MLNQIIGPAVVPAIQLLSVLTLAVSALIIALGFVAEPFTDRDRTRYIAARYQLQAFSQTIEEYRRDCDSYPSAQSGLRALVENPGADCWKGPYLKAVPVDPWGRAYRYELDSVLRPEIICYGADGLKGGNLFAADLSTNRPNQQIPESALEARMRRLYLSVWLSAWVGLAVSVSVYGKASRHGNQRRSVR